jgi:hypothetical protein
MPVSGDPQPIFVSLMVPSAPAPAPATVGADGVDPLRREAALSDDEFQVRHLTPADT